MTISILLPLSNLITTSEELSKKLSRPISDLDDVRDSMAALAKIRSKEIEIDMVIGPIEVKTNFMVVRNNS